MDREFSSDATSQSSMRALLTCGTVSMLRPRCRSEYSQAFLRGSSMSSKVQVETGTVRIEQYKVVTYSYGLGDDVFFLLNGGPAFLVIICEIRWSPWSTRAIAL